MYESYFLKFIGDVKKHKAKGKKDTRSEARHRARGDLEPRRQLDQAYYQNMGLAQMLHGNQQPANNRYQSALGGAGLYQRPQALPLGVYTAQIQTPPKQISQKQAQADALAKTLQQKGTYQNIPLPKVSSAKKPPPPPVGRMMAKPTKDVIEIPLLDPVTGMGMISSIHDQPKPKKP